MAEGTGRRRGTDSDLQGDIEDEMLASGRTHYQPREGLSGAHAQRRQGLGADPEQGEREPGSGGTHVAPTRKAEMREATRHRLEHQVGHLAAGEAEGVVRQYRSRFATREALDGIAAEADELMARLRLTAEGRALPWSRRAGDWLWQHRIAVAVGLGAALLTTGCVALARRR